MMQTECFGGVRRLQRKLNAPYLLQDHNRSPCRCRLGQGARTAPSSRQCTPARWPLLRKKRPLHGDRVGYLGVPGLMGQFLPTGEESQEPSVQLRHVVAIRRPAYQTVGSECVEDRVLSLMQ
jgi:hypothetical protein